MKYKDEVREAIREIDKMLPWSPEIDDWVYFTSQLDSKFDRVFQLKEIHIERSKIWLRPREGEAYGKDRAFCRPALPHEIP